MPPFNPKRDTQYRIYDVELAKHDPIQARVLETYTQMHTYQTVEFVREQHVKWTAFNHAEMTAIEAIDALSTFVDASDPDVNFSNDNHAYQSAEAVRAKYPDNKWLQVTALVHDMGKVLHIFGQPQWATVGDTFVVGCAPGPHVVLREHTFHDNVDMKNLMYNTKYGMYEPNCGFDNVLMSFGHDEYIYQVLKNHKDCKLPPEALYILRFHSFYPWHSKGDYEHLASDYDKNMLSQLLLFNEFDLYSKVEKLPPIEELKPYYQELLDYYVPGKIKF